MAKIAQASSEAAPILDEVSTAKIQYDARARKLLSPEQYDKYKEFETRQALEREWQAFGVKNFDNLSAADLKLIARSMEELGIRETKSETMLPFEPGPSSGNRISVPDFSPAESVGIQIGRLDAAATDLPVIAERNQLSDRAKETLATMVKNRRDSLREGLQNLLQSEAESSARWGAIQQSLHPQ